MRKNPSTLYDTGAWLAYTYIKIFLFWIKQLCSERIWNFSSWPISLHTLSKINFRDRCLPKTLEVKVLVTLLYTALPLRCLQSSCCDCQRFHDVFSACTALSLCSHCADGVLKTHILLIFTTLFVFILQTPMEKRLGSAMIAVTVPYSFVKSAVK